MNHVRYETPYVTPCGCAYVKVERLVLVPWTRQTMRMMDLESVQRCAEHGGKP